MGFAEGQSLRAWRGTPPERKRLAEQICRDFVRQVFMLNPLHADTHPGNLRIDAEGRITYLDFGTVGRLDTRSRRGLFRLLRAVLEDDAELAVSAVLALGKTDAGAVDRHQPTANVDRIIQLCRSRARLRWTDEVVRATRRHRRLPRSILLYVKATMLSESLVSELDPDFELLPVLADLAGPVMRMELDERLADLRRTLPELAAAYAELARRLPGRIEDFLEGGLPSHLRAGRPRP